MGRREGRDAIVADDTVEPIELAKGGVISYPVWGRDKADTVPGEGQEPEQSAAFPPPAGFRYVILTIPAGANEAYHGFIDTALAPFATPGRPGLHRTPTLDCIVVTQGELLLEGDEDSTIVRAGDSVIINGNRHRWSNPGREDAVLHAISLGTEASE